MIFIAEIGLNHNGNFDLCYELIRQAKYAGADIAKFQLGWRGNRDEMNYLDEERLSLLMKWGRYFEIEIMFSVFSGAALEMIRPFNVPRFKVASRTVKDDLDLVRSIVAEGKPTYVSLGMWDRDEPPIVGANNIQYLWCRSKYPCTPWDLSGLPRDFTSSMYDGYSDHTIGIDTCLLAIARGAKVIEKHFTLDKSNTTIRDHCLSSTPGEFGIMCSLGREIYKKIELGV